MANLIKPTIECSAKNCRFNKEGNCCGKTIVIEGLFSRSRLGTFCESFAKQSELSPITQRKKSANVVRCSANYCKHSQKGYCTASVIKIKGGNCSYRSETECESFELN